MSMPDTAVSSQGFNNHIWDRNGSLGMAYNDQARARDTPSPGQLDEDCPKYPFRQDYASEQKAVEFRESTSEHKEESSFRYERTQDRRSLAGTVYGPPIGAPPGHYKRPAPPGTPKLEIAHIGSSGFKKGSFNSVIEVLLDEPRISIPARYRKSSVLYADSRSPPRKMPIVRQNPRRVRIRSPKLLKALEGIAEQAGHSFLTSGTVSLVFQYPFKLFVTLEPHIRTKVTQLNGQAPHEESDIASTSRADSVIASSNIDNETFEHLRLLVKLFDTDLKPMFDMRQDIENRKLINIAFMDLWHLFDFGQDIRTSDSDSQVYRVLRFSGGREPLAKHGLLAELQARATLDAQSSQRNENRGETFIMDAVSYEVDGSQYGPVQKTFIIRKYDGEKAITNLPFFPLDFDPNHESIRKRLIKRGELYLQLSQSDHASHKHYTGLTLDEPREEVDSQIIVDTKMAMMRYYTTLPSVGVLNLVTHNLRETYEETVNPTVTDGICAEDGCCDNDLVHKDYGWEMQHEEKFFEEHKAVLAPTADPGDLEDEEKMLLPPFVHGFILRSRKWAKFDISLIRNVEYTSGFDDLVLPTGHKETVRALVATHAREPSAEAKKSQNQQSIDLVRGKGKGLVILLHGAPGVGKTSTAECVADTTKRPLFPITCGDIGDTAAEVETNLESSFQLAHKWGCVLLLDEADIFLQKRDKTDIKRNSIVSVFLRALEYYSGILFLTTNRVGLFDPAFRSRIHISLYYPGLQKDATIQIWKMHLARTQAIKGDNFKIKNKEVLRFAKDHYMELKKAGSGSWNGRQIRNAFQTAIALAEFEAAEKKTDRIELSQTHFATVAKASAEFDTYLRSTLGGQTEADIARLEQTRMDEYSALKVRNEYSSRAPKQKGRGGRKTKDETDSEDSDQDSEASEDSEEDSKGSASEEDSGEEEPVPVAPPKKKKENKRRK